MILNNLFHLCIIFCLHGEIVHAQRIDETKIPKYIRVKIDIDNSKNQLDFISKDEKSSFIIKL